MSKKNKVVILAGGLGTRISEETDVKPKPMVEIGGKPILWHIMKIYSSFGYNDFIVCLGYKGYLIKEWFANYSLHMSDVTIDMQNSNVDVHQNYAEPWKVTLIDTGDNTMTGGRVNKVREYVGDNTFLMTYGDGVSDININELVDFHKKHGKKATITAVQPTGRYGALNLDDQNAVLDFEEKPKGDGAWINGGFFILEPQVFEYINGDDTIWEREPLEGLASKGELVAYKHNRFWQPMDTLRDKHHLENLWDSGRAPWKIWT